MAEPTFFSFDFMGQTGRRNFKSLEELSAFVSTHINSYQWLVSIGSNTSQFIVSEIFNALIHTRQIISQESHLNNFGQRIDHQFQSIFINNKLPVAGSNEFDFIEGIRIERGGNVAVAALSYLTSKLSHLQLSSKETWDGLLLAFTRQEGVNKAAAASARATYDRINNKSQTIISELQDNEASRERQYAKFLKSVDRRHSTLLRWKSRQFDNHMKTFDAEKISAFEEMIKVRNTHEEMMKLKAPVDYWRDKAKAHRSEAEMYRRLLIYWGWRIGCGVLASLIVIALLSFVFVYADKPTASYLILATIGIVITTMAFWAARIVVRLYMSEHHLSIDADERATMAMTYLALIERGAAEEKDRALILAPLFRPSSDGIVKDDAAPDLSPAGLLSKALSK